MAAELTAGAMMAAAVTTTGVIVSPVVSVVAGVALTVGITMFYGELAHLAYHKYRGTAPRGYFWQFWK